MEALVVRVCASALCLVLATPFFATAASHRTENFIVNARTRALAIEIGEAAERYRAELAIEWLGHTLPRWSQPCPIQANVDPRKGAGGATSFVFETSEPTYARASHRPTGDGLFQSKPAGRPFGWEMTVEGSRQRILDSVLPHEVTHTIFASHFGRPLPRWADEGACTTVEHHSEKAKQHQNLYQYLKTDRGIAFNRMFSMTEYPADILPLYSQGFSLARFLISQGGKRKFVEYIGDGLESNDWTSSTQSHYGYESLSDLQVTWLDWVRNGSPQDVAQFGGHNRDRTGDVSAQLLASNAGRNAGQNAGVRNSGVSGSNGRSLAQPVAARQFTEPQPIRTEGQHGPSVINTRSDSWYAQQRRASGERTKSPASSPRSQPAPRPRKLIASRPDQAAVKREVLMEWGQPSPILAPTLAENKAAWQVVR